MLRAGLLIPFMALSAGCGAIGVPTPTAAPALALSRPAQPVVKVAASTAPQPSLPTVVAAATAPPAPTARPSAAPVAPATPTLAPSPTPVPAAPPPPVVPPSSSGAAAPQPAAPAVKPAEPAAVVAEPTATLVPPTASPTPAPASPTPTSTALPATATSTVTPTVTITPTITTTPVPNQVNQRFVSGPVALTVLNVAKATGSPGNLRVIADVSVENVGQTTMGITPVYFKLSVGSGGPNSPYTAGAEGTTIPATTRNAGERVQANVAFEVPIEAHGLILYYDPQPPPANYTIIRIGLGE